MLNRQAPNIQILTNIHDNIYNKARVDSERQSYAQEHVRNHILAVAQRALPALDVLRAQRISNPVQDREEEDVDVRIRGLGEVRGDNETDLVGGGETDEEKERDEMREEDWAEVEPGGDEDPGAEEGGEAEEGGSEGKVLRATSFDDGNAAGIY